MVASSGSLEGMLKLSTESTSADGSNRTTMVQVSVGARVAPEQVLPATTKLNGAARALPAPTVLITRSPEPSLVTVTVWSTAAAARSTDPKGICRSFAGATESVTVMSGIVTAMPVPLTFKVTVGVPESLDGISSASLNGPSAVGENTTWKVHVPAGATDWPEQVLVPTVYGAASGLADATCPMVRFALPALVTVTVWVLVPPCVISPKGTVRSFIGATESVTAMTGAGTARPAPETATVIDGSSGSSDVRSKLPVEACTATGANCTVTVQLLSGVRGAVQVLAVMLNGAAGGVMAPIVRSASPLLVTVTVPEIVVLIVRLPKASARSFTSGIESVTAMFGTAGVPVPLTATVTAGVCGSSDGILKSSVEETRAVGLNLTVTVQLLFGVSVWLEQRSVMMLNGAASALADATAPIVRSRPPVLVTVTVWVFAVATVILPKATARSLVGTTESVTEMFGSGGAAATVTVAWV